MKYDPFLFNYHKHDIFAYVCIYIHIFAYVCIYIHYICMYIHMYVYTYIHTIYLHMYVYMLVIVEMQMSTLALNVFTICLRIINNQPKNLTNYETTKSRSFIENRRGPPVITSSSTPSSPKCKEGKATSGFNSK